MRVCLCVCPRAYLRNYWSNLHQFFLHITYGRAWLDRPLAALRWPEIGDAEKAHTQSGPAGGNKDLHRGVHSIRGCPITGAAKGGGGTPPPRNWVLEKIPGCAVELNTQNCAWFGSQISLITAMSFREAMPPEPPTSPWTPLGDFRSPDPLCPTSKSWLRQCAPCLASLSIRSAVESVLPHVESLLSICFLCRLFLAIMHKHNVIHKTGSTQHRNATTEEGQATAIGNMHKISEDRIYSSGDELSGRQTRTDTHANTQTRSS